MNNLKISFIGAGNMASSIIGGLIAQGVPAKNITASDPDTNNLAKVANFAINTSQDNVLAVAEADVIILSVKPQVMQSVCVQLAGQIHPGTLIISIAAGIDCRSLANWLGESRAIVRCMPNTPALVMEGASALFSNSNISDAQKAVAFGILSAVGIVVWVTQEHELDIVTAVSGSGPAYFFLVIEAMINAATQMGLARSTAETLAMQTALGAAKLAKESDVDIVELRRRVTSPKGTTEQAIAVFEEHNIRQIFNKAMQACADRSQALTLELGTPH